jgi:hypothetical protein
LIRSKSSWGFPRRVKRMERIDDEKNFVRPTLCRQALTDLCSLRGIPSLKAWDSL